MQMANMRLNEPARLGLQCIRGEIRVKHLNFAKVHLLSELTVVLDHIQILNEKAGCEDYRLGHSVHEGHGEEEDEGFHQEPVREEHLQESLQSLLIREVPSWKASPCRKCYNWQNVTTGASLR